MQPGSLVRPARVIRRPPIATRIVLIVVAMAACHSPERTLVVGGDPGRGKQDVRAMGCGACHSIDGLAGANGEVGPPLTGVGRRSILAGEVPNTPANMVRWLENPQAIEPNTAMPNLGIQPQSARDIAAYLYTLR